MEDIKAGLFTRNTENCKTKKSSPVSLFTETWRVPLDSYSEHSSATV